MDLVSDPQPMETRAESSLLNHWQTHTPAATMTRIKLITPLASTLHGGSVK